MLSRYVFRWTLALVALVGSWTGLEAQRASLRTNLLGLAAGNLNLEYSRMISPNFTAGVLVQLKPISYPLPAPVGLLRYMEGLTNQKEHILKFGTIKHTENYTLEPTIRYWFLGAYNQGLFLGGHAMASYFKYGGDRFDSTYRQGFSVGAGVSAGYSFNLSLRCNLEVELGLGYVYRDYRNVYTNGVKSERMTDFVPTFSRLGLNLTYLLP